MKIIEIIRPSNLVYSTHVVKETEDLVNILIEKYEIEMYNAFDDHLNSLYEPVELARFEFSPSKTLKSSDMTVYKDVFMDWLAITAFDTLLHLDRHGKACISDVEFELVCIAEDNRN